MSLRMPQQWPSDRATRATPTDGSTVRRVIGARSACNHGAMAKIIPITLVCAAVLLGGCSGSDGDSTSTTSTTSASAGGSDSSSSTTTSDPGDSATGDEAARGAIVGQWTADASGILGSNLSNLGGTPAGMSCTGPLTLDFAADGGFVASGEATCTLGGVSLTASITTTGQWSSEDDGSITISGASSEGGFDVPGVEIPPIELLSDGQFDYTISGDTLSLTFTDPTVGTVTQDWTRA